MDGRRERGDQRRAVLLDAGIRIVADQGSKALTHRAVAHAAGVSAASVGYHFATAHDLRDGVFRSAGERIRTAILAILLASDTSLPLAELYGRAARALVTEESPAIVTVFEMMLESRHEAALAEAAASLTNRLVRHLEATAGPGIDGALIAACLQGLVLASLSLPIESRGPWLEQATVALLQRCA